MSGIDANTLLLLHGDSLEDSSQYKVALTNNGAQVSSEQSKFGGKSLYFDGNTAFLSVDIQLNGDATVDFWMFPISKNRYPMVVELEWDGTYGVVWQGLEYNSEYEFGTRLPNGEYKAQSVSPVPDDFWSHIAIVRKEQKLILFVDGKTTYTHEGAGTENSKIRIGYTVSDNGDEFYFNGYIDEFRVSNMARWDSDFTPPSEPYAEEPVAPQSPGNFSYSVSGGTITLSWGSVSDAEGYRVYKNGVLVSEQMETSFPDDVDFFTESQYAVSAYNTNGESEKSALSVYLEPENPIPYLITDRTQQDVEQNTAKGSYNASDLNRVTACMEYLDDELRKLGYESGYIPVVVHPDGFPSEDRNTLLLLHGDEISDGSLYSVPLTNYGVQVSDLHSKFGGKSLYFDGKSSVVLNELLEISKSNFTIEWWEYLPSKMSNYGNVWSFTDAGGLNGVLLAYADDGLTLWDSPFDGEVIGYQEVNDWLHRAFVRNKDTLQFYVNGKKSWEYTFSDDFPLYKMVLGGRIAHSGQYWSGYMDEFRISNVARWTSDFIPPTEPYKTEIPVTGKAPYRWHKEDSPTISQLQQYLANVAALRSVFESVRDAPNVPASPRKIKTDKANDIEKILGIIEGTILTLRKTFVACGPATCGGDYL